ncbi:MAG TPA: PepSY-associated TM helix domain-containing protein [Allosphingosinicella sp.]|nr:PepSY-associated TM helix domain-containing protein [Allosphingosinicella sp.]
MFRRGLSLLHRWLGLFCGLYLACIGISGAALVAAPHLFAWEYGIPSASADDPARDYASPDVWLSKARAAYGQLPAIESFNAPLATPMRIGAPTMVYSTMRDGAYATGVIVVEPYSGAPLAHFIAQDSWSLVPLTLHMSLFLPYTLLWTVLITLAWVLIVLVIAGILSWRSAGGWRRNLLPGFGKNAPALRRLHIAIGLWSMPVLMLTATTGLLMTDKSGAERIYAMLGRAPSEVTPGAHPCAGTISPGQALAIARQATPGTELGTLGVPDEMSGPDYRITLRDRGSHVPARGDTVVSVTPCGQLRSVRPANSNFIGDSLSATVSDIHGGRALGLIGEALIVLGGLALFALPLLGFLAWGRRLRRARSAPDEVARGE